MTRETITNCHIRNYKSEFPVNLQGIEKRPKHHDQYGFKRSSCKPEPPRPETPGDEAIEAETSIIPTHKPNLIPFSIGVLTFKRGA
ncbi:TPA: hypothetical protein DIV55_05915 [Patescibacteria group bacterium]|uniref:Uncharacterized protein n=1 Tax=Candidatus Gottesmanbacteria bacterium GW2011_GWA1_43_11 TaxID=1618436 RepID=A0A0G1FFD7_9BACT|nr:MAG: hypothetical protein UV59_C0006G0024 [Candidatus Gottesmanbacteria bacterium GW2011_GWA1_43_11]HCS79244.1 hypothetical protein [Patescibacteria group bacterium]